MQAVAARKPSPCEKQEQIAFPESPKIRQLFYTKETYETVLREAMALRDQGIYVELLAKSCDTKKQFPEENRN